MKFANVASKSVGRRSSGESVIVKLHDGVSKTTGHGKVLEIKLLPPGNSR